jgi:hypothetical protein
MATLPINGIAILLAAILICLAAWKWRVVADRTSILSVIKTALNDRKALSAGIFFGVFYLAVYMIWGGKGGRIHLLFGRWILNTTAGEMLVGFMLGLLVMISMALFVYGVRVMGLTQSGKKGATGFGGGLLALLAAFCP